MAASGLLSGGSDLVITTGTGGAKETVARSDMALGDGQDNLGHDVRGGEYTTTDHVRRFAPPTPNI